MSTISDEMVEAALQGWFKDGSAWNRQMTPEIQQDMRASMRAALQAAEAVRVKAEAGGRNFVHIKTFRSDVKFTERELAMMKKYDDTPTIPEGFIPWHGGECPVASGTVVAVLFRDGEIYDERTILQWNDWWYWRDHERDDDVMAYRIHKPADFKLQAGRYYIDATGKREGPMHILCSGETDAFGAPGTPAVWNCYGDEVYCKDPSLKLLALAANQEPDND